MHFLRRRSRTPRSGRPSSRRMLFCELLEERLPLTGVAIGDAPWVDNGFVLNITEFDETTLEISATDQGNVVLSIDGEVQVLPMELQASSIASISVDVSADNAGATIDLRDVNTQSGFNYDWVRQCIFITGGDGNDTIFASPNQDIIDAGAGNDSVILSSTAHSVEGGDGVDSLLIEVSTLFDITAATDETDSGLTIFGSDLELEASGFESVAIEQTSVEVDAVLSVDASLVSDNSFGFQFTGGEGDDIFIGGAGNDVLIVSAGNDNFVGGLGSNQIVASLTQTTTSIFETTDEDELLASGDFELTATDVAIVEITLETEDQDSGLDLDASQVTNAAIGFDVTTRGTAFNNIFGGAGDDFFRLFGISDDLVSPGAGADRVELYAGDDIVIAEPDDDDDFYDGGDGEFDIFDGRRESRDTHINFEIFSDSDDGEGEGLLSGLLQGSLL